MIAAAESESSGVEAHAGDEGPGNKTASESWHAERTKLKVTATATVTKTVVLAKSICAQEAIARKCLHTLVVQVVVRISYRSLSSVSAIPMVFSSLFPTFYCIL